MGLGVGRQAERERGESDWERERHGLGDGAWGRSAEPIGDEGAGDGNGVGWEMREMRVDERIELESDEERDHGEIE